ncbi:hypothetical protein LguiA_015953 [Lonicera macranthoides]
MIGERPTSTSNLLHPKPDKVYDANVNPKRDPPFCPLSPSTGPTTHPFSKLN